MLHTRPILPREARKAPTTVSGVRFHMRRNHMGMSGDVTDAVRTWPLEKVRRWVQHGIMRCDPVSNYLVWGKEVGPWCTKHRVVHPRTLVELEAVQAAIAAGDPSGLPKVPDNAIPQADDEAPADEEVTNPGNPVAPPADGVDEPKAGDPPAAPTGKPSKKPKKS